MDESTIKGMTLLELNDSESSDAPFRKSRMTVTGYDASLPKGVIKSALIKHFSPCGEIIHAIIPGGSQTGGLYKRALVYIRGEGAAEKAVKLNGGCECDVEECKIVVDKVMQPDRNPNRVPLNCGGLNLPACFTPLKANMTTE